jgi:hypothetical protein
MYHFSKNVHFLKPLKKVMVTTIENLKIIPYHNFSFQCGKDFHRISKRVFDFGHLFLSIFHFTKILLKILKN